MFEPMTDAEVEQLNYTQQPLGPSSRNCCKVANGNTCGSGSLVGVRDGKSLVLTNAHVAGTRIGKTMSCTFPFAGNARVGAKVIMAGYSDRIMMDWAVLELETYLNELPHVKLANKVPEGDHYTGGYPRCKGPYFQRLKTRQIIYSGTVWKWQPNSIGGQSGSGVHSFADDLQYGLLTWSWGGDGAGQTTRSIWFQYANRAAVGFPRPDGLIELNENRAEDLEEGFFAEANITTLPIWAHLDDKPEPEPEPPVEPGDCDALASKIKAEADALREQAKRLDALASQYKAKPEDDGDSGDGCDDDTGPLFGLD